MDGFKNVFLTSQNNFENNHDFDFSKFREKKDVYGFCLGEGPLNWEMFSRAYHQDRKLFSKYIGVPKSKFGYGDIVKWAHIDSMDCAHIFYSTFIFSHCENIKQIVEIGAGYGNLYRLNHSIINFDKWTLIDLPFVGELQKKYISHEVKDLRRVDFASAYNYSHSIPNRFDLCIGSHSISELAWDDFMAYYNRVIKNSKYFFYAGHTWNAGADLLIRKLELINQDFNIIKKWDADFIDSYNDNQIYNNLYMRKNDTI